MPFVVISPADATPDEEEPLLEAQRYNVRLVVSVMGDAFGEAALVGGPRDNGQGSSDGRGLMEVEEELLKVIADINATEGAKIRTNWKSGAQALEDEDLGYVVSREYLIESWVGVERAYPAPRALAATDAGGGQADLTWELPPDRFDRDAIVLRRASGSTPPSTVTDGTGVTVGALVTSVSDTPGIGTWSYSLFMGYDELESGSSDRYSEPDTVTVTLS
jgi:hypothetical protein